MRLASQTRNYLKTRLHSLFVVGQKMGVDVLPRHFYSSIPDISDLRKNQAWKKASSMVGVAGTELEPQLNLLRQWAGPLKDRLAKGDIHDHACKRNGEAGYGTIEAELLYSFIFTNQPKRIVQIGCGVSTAVILLAAKEANYKPEIVCVEPYPTQFLQDLAKDGSITLIAKKMEDVDLDVFTKLEAGDLFFVDSTHTVRPGGEVNRIILEVLYRLQPGLYVHFHDVYFPYDYTSGLMTSLVFPGESTLLHAFLIGNARYSIAVCMSMLHHARPDDVKLVFPNYKPAVMDHGLHTVPLEQRGHFPSSAYFLVS
jgi:predicted O-methyltransferase YrrM